MDPGSSCSSGEVAGWSGGRPAPGVTSVVVRQGITFYRHWEREFWNGPRQGSRGTRPVLGEITIVKMVDIVENPRKLGSGCCGNEN